MRALVALLLLAISSTAFAAHQPICRPKAPWTHFKFGSINDGISTRYDTWSAWVCETPTGYITEVSLFNLAANANVFLKYAAGLISDSDATADCAQTCVDPIAGENDLMKSLLAQYRPMALVAFNGSSLTRSVFSLNTDGTLNPTPVAGASIQVASRCSEWKFIAGSKLPNGTAYYSVQGQPNASAPGTLMTGDVYALCTISLPLGVN